MQYVLLLGEEHHVKKLVVPYIIREVATQFIFHNVHDNVL